jgi:N6-L-threonylcarbamoyladenine synthase
MEIIGQPIDDAAGEAFDKCAKTIGLPYPGGPMVDKYAKLGNPQAFTFTRPKVKGFDYSFSGLKTAFMYFVRDRIKENLDFVKENRDDLCASIQFTIIDILLTKLKLAIKETGIKEIAVAGGVSANSGLRNTLESYGERQALNVYFPEFKFTTDNAAMIAITGYHKYLKGEFVGQDITPLARMPI